MAHLEGLLREVHSIPQRAIQVQTEAACAFIRVCGWSVWRSWAKAGWVNSKQKEQD